VTRVALALGVTPRASVGMRAVAAALRDGLPRAAPEITFVNVDAAPLLQPFALRAARADLVHAPYLENGPLPPRPYTMMAHDLIQLRFPHLFSRVTALYWRAVAAPLLRGAARVLVSDARVGDDLHALLGISRARIRVVPLGYDARVLSAKPYVAPRPYAFYAGNHRPHKNLATLYAAWAALPDGLALDLAVTGPDDPTARARYLRRSGTLTFTGDLDDEALASRYAGAACYVQPSLAEGFGIPMLEAAVAGTPVIASREAVPAILAGYAQTFAARDVAALTRLLAEPARDPTAARAAAAEGAIALRAYTWDRFAAETAAVFREVLCL
jgi:glycosyltransferase involved in cell wall biosynthesis